MLFSFNNYNAYGVLLEFDGSRVLVNHFDLLLCYLRSQQGDMAEPLKKLETLEPPKQFPVPLDDHLLFLFCGISVIYD